MKYPHPPRLITPALAALAGALFSVAACIVLSFFPDFSIPLPGMTFGRVNVGMLGNAPLPYAALSGALAGVALLLTMRNERQEKATF